MSGPTPDKALIGVPDRWMHCPKTGKVVDGLFFPFKTPLCSLYDSQIEKKLRFHPEDVFNHPAVRGKKIGLWIDLTKTDRYYFVKEVESQGCIYRKIPLAGHGSSPTQEETDRFVRLVQGFTRDHPGELVGVHCTHGFNRTGFLIAAYMVVVKDWAVDFAVLTFAKERPCGIYKQDYLGDLFERYGDPDDCLEAPNKPAWEYGDAVGYEDSDEPSTSVAHDNRENQENGAAKPKGKQFMDGLVRGVELVEDPLKKKMLQGKVKELVGAKRDGFPGLQPVSLERSRDHDNLKLLAQRPYMVSWKADGMRYMIYICDENEIYAFDRDNEVFLIRGLSFPHRKHPRHIVNTLVDAEMIIDHDVHVGKENFDIRFMCIRKELIEPRNAAIKNGQWVFMRERTDKSLPNALKTAQSVYNSMINPIDKNMLIDFVARYGYKRHVRQEPDAKRPRVQ
ncbi:unnamed protein product [Nippostrongylus brasiliensis]|uniref:mRNA guanylyltransferase n=1 Tax=Nippostrongylus brasiliensis TaxID=27835 RepID=A0A0N4Y3P5_NIPBR|nr:unnamed protein product [Nippostrongylus brasiliensis]